MKQELILLQPKQYNELFSTYHSKKNINPNSRVNLPKITTVFSKEWETAASTSRTNKTNTSTLTNYMNQNKINIYSSKKTSYIFNKKREIFYPYVTQQRESETSRMSQFLPYPSITQRFKKIVDQKSKEKKKFKKNRKDLKMIYLNLINREYCRNEYKIDSFLTESEKTKNDFLSTKLSDKMSDKFSEINSNNNNNIQRRLRDVFSQTTHNMIKKEISMIKNVPVILINSFAQDIYNSYYNSDYKQKTINKNKNDNIKDHKKSLNNQYKNLYINNTFFQYVLDNVKHKIEIINENNKLITVLYVTNLINDELRSLQKQISVYKKQYLTDNNNNSYSASKTSNYETNSKNTFKFKTNTSIIKDNENISPNDNNDNSGVLGSIIKNNIYLKRNFGTKKRQFETLNMFRINPNTFFQNKEIISSINKKDDSNSDEKSPKKMKTINAYKNKKKINSNNDDKINKNKFNVKYNLTISNSADNVNKRFGRNNSQNFGKKPKKKIERTFSEVFLKKDYIKASDCITEISNKIERQYLFRKHLKKRKMLYNEDYITPKRYRKSIGTITDYKENKNIKFKDKKMKNKYENVFENISEIRQSDNKNINNISKRNSVNYNTEFNKREKLFFNGGGNNINNNFNYNNDLLQNEINEINTNNLYQKNIFNKMATTRNIDKNKDLKSIKSSNSIFKKNNKNKEKTTDTKYNTINSHKSKKNSKNKKYIGSPNKKNKKNKKHHNANNKKKKKRSKKNKKKNSNLNESGQESSSQESEEDESSFEEESEDSVESEESEESEQSEEEKVEKSPEQHIKNIIIRMEKEKKRTLKQVKYDKRQSFFVNTLSNDKGIFHAINVKEKKEAEHKSPKINRKLLKRNSVVITPTKQLIHLENETNSPKKKKMAKSKSTTKNEKLRKNSVSYHQIHHHTTRRQSILDVKESIVKKKLFEQGIFEELDEDSNEYNDDDDENNHKKFQKFNFGNNTKNLTKNKKNKKNIGHMIGDMLGKGRNKNDDDANLMFEDDDGMDDLVIKEGKGKKKNAERDEEIKILNEIEEMEEALTLDEKRFIVSEMVKLRHLMVNEVRNNKETRDEINKKRIGIFKIINKFFENWITKDLSLKIVDYQKYKNKLDKLVIIQSYRVYSERNLRNLERKYIIPFIEKEKQRIKEEEEQKEKLKKKKLAEEEFERYKKLIEEKKRKGLVYDNSYMFKKGKKKQFILRKEVQDILNTDYGADYNKFKIRIDAKRKKTIKKKKGKIITNSKKTLMEVEDFSEHEIPEEEKRVQIMKETEEQKMIEEMRDKRLQEFFKKIQKLKSGNFANFEEELNSLIEEQYDHDVIVKEKKEMRMNSFMKEFIFSRVKAKYNSDFRNKQIGFISPIIFSSGSSKSKKNKKKI